MSEAPSQNAESPRDAELAKIFRNHPGVESNLKPILEDDSSRVPAEGIVLNPSSRDAAVAILQSDLFTTAEKDRVVRAHALWYRNARSSGSGAPVMRGDMIHPVLDAALAQAFPLDQNDSPRNTGGVPPTGTGENGDDEQPPENEPAWKRLDLKNYIGVDVKTIESIIHNPEEQRFFGLMLSSIDPAMANIQPAVIGEGSKLSSDQRQFLQYARYEFSKWYPRAKALATKIDSGDVKAAAGRNEAIDADMGLRGPERVAEIFKNEVLKKAMREPERFHEFEVAHKALRSDQSTLRFKNWDKKTHALCEKLGIKPRDFDAMFDMSRGNRAETRKRLQEWVRRDMGTLRKAVEFTLGTIRLDKAQRAMQKADKLNIVNAPLPAQRFWSSPRSWVLSRVDENLSTITNFMAETISENQEVQHALEQEAFISKNLELAEDSGPKTRTEAGTEAAKLNTPEAVVKRYDNARRVATNADGKHYNDWSRNERLDFKNNWDPHLRYARSKGGRLLGGYSECSHSRILEKARAQKPVVY